MTEKHVVWITGASKSGKSSLTTATIGLPPFIDMSLTDDHPVMLPIQFRHHLKPTWSFNMAFKGKDTWADMESKLALNLYGAVQACIDQHGQDDVINIFDIVANKRNIPLSIYGTLRKSLREAMLTQQVSDPTNMMWAVQPDSADAVQASLDFVQLGRVPKFLQIHRSGNLWHKTIKLHDLNEFEINLLIYLFGKHHDSELDVNMCLMIVNAIVNPTLTIGLATQVWQIYMQHYVDQVCLKTDQCAKQRDGSLPEQSSSSSSESPSCACQAEIGATTELMKVRLASAKALADKCPELKIAINHICFTQLLNYWPVLDHLMIIGPVHLPNQVCLIDMPSSNPLMHNLDYTHMMKAYNRKNPATHHLWYCRQPQSPTTLEDFCKIMSHYDRERVHLLMTQSVHPCLRHLVDANANDPIRSVKDDRALSKMVHVAELVKHLPKEDHMTTIALLSSIHLHAISSYCHSLALYAKRCQMARDGQTEPQYPCLRLFHASMRDMDNPAADEIAAKLQAQTNEQLRRHQCEMLEASGISELRAHLKDMTKICPLQQ